jgi:hypothetical protein
VFGIFFQNGARVRYPKTTSEQDGVARKNSKTITTSPTAGFSDEQAPPMPSPVTRTMPVFSPTMDTNVVTASVTYDIRINTLMQLPEEAKVNDKDGIVKYVSHGLEGVTVLYNWASHRLNMRGGYNTPMLSETDDNLFAVVKAIVDAELSPEEDQLNETYTKKGKNLFYKKQQE